MRWPLVGSGVALILAAGVMLAITRETSILVPIGMSLLLGFMNGFSGFGNQAALYLQAPAGDIAVASGLLRTSTYIGAIFSSSLIGITFGPAATDAGFHSLAWGLVGIGLDVLVLTALDRSVPTVAT